MLRSKILESVLPLCLDPRPILRARARRVEAFTDEVRLLSARLIETMRAHDGVGLAAPQVGRSVQMFVANPSRRRGSELVVINPVVERLEGRSAILEGCLSLPEVWERVRRAARIHLRGQDVEGRPCRVEADGLLAIVLQHEVDHLQGRLFIDRLPWWRRRVIASRLAARRGTSMTPMGARAQQAVKHAWRSTFTDACA